MFTGSGSPCKVLDTLQRITRGCVKIGTPSIRGWGGYWVVMFRVLLGSWSDEQVRTRDDGERWLWMSSCARPLKAGMLNSWQSSCLGWSNSRGDRSWVIAAVIPKYLCPSDYIKIPYTPSTALVAMQCRRAWASWMGKRLSRSNSESHCFGGRKWQNAALQPAFSHF